MVSSRSFVSASAFSSLFALVASQQCALAVDGRVPAGFQLAQFDSANGIFNPDFVKGQNLSFSEIIKLPNIAPSTFDRAASAIPFELTLSDESIFAPSATNVQIGFRRVEAQFASNNGSDPSTTGVKTLHFSLMKDNARPLNLSHEYQLVFLEDASFSTNQFVLKTGTLIGVDTPDPDTLQLFGNVNSNPVPTLFTTKFTPNTFHNFALTLDFTKNTTQVFYSTGCNALKQVTEPIANNVAGQGQYHIGALKKPTNPGADVTKSGFQPDAIDEGLIYSGVFIEESGDGCVSLTA